MFPLTNIPNHTGATSLAPNKNLTSAQPTTGEEFIDSLNLGEFGEEVTLIAGEVELNEGVLKKFLDKMVEKSKSISLQQDDQIVFLENAYSKLDYLNLELQKPENTSSEAFKKYFAESIHYVEGHLIRYINNLDHKYSEFNALLLDATIQKKIDALKFPKESTQTTTNPSAKAHPITNAKGEKFIAKGDKDYNRGNCGLKAFAEATNKTVNSFNQTTARLELVNVQNAHKALHSALEQGQDSTIKEADLKLIFGEFSFCKAYLEKTIEEKLAIPDLRNKKDFELLKAQINAASNFSDVLNNPNLLRFIHLNMAFEFSEDAHVDRTRLTNGDIEALMFSKGYVCTDFGTKENGKKAQSNAQTVMQFNQLATGKSAYIAINSTPEGSHWVCVEKVTKAT